MYREPDRPEHLIPSRLKRFWKGVRVVLKFEPPCPATPFWFGHTWYVCEQECCYVCDECGERRSRPEPQIFDGVAP